MKTRWTMAAPALVAALGVALCLVFAGCSGKNDRAFPRHLKRGEARELLAIQGMRHQGDGGDGEGSDTITDTKRLEAMGDSKAAQGDLTSALFFYTRSLALDKENTRVELRAKIAIIYLHARQFIQAEDIFQDLVRAEPDQAGYWQGLGLARLGRGNREAAKSALLQAVGLDQKLWKAYNGLGMLYNQDRQFDQAIQAFSRAIAIQPRSPQLYNNLGMSYLLKADFGKAEQCFRYALKLDPEYKRAANNLGLVYARQGKYSKAHQAFSRGSGKHQAHNNIGCFLAWAGDNERAADEFRKALRLSPSYYPLAGRHLKQLSGPSAAVGGEDVDPLLTPPVTSPGDVGQGSRPPARPAVSRGQAKPSADSKPTAPAARPVAAMSPVVLPQALPLVSQDNSQVNRLNESAGAQQAPPSGFGWGQGDVRFDQQPQGALRED